MKAAIIERPGVVRIEERDLPQAGSEDVVVRVAASGVCGTDVHIYHGGFRADYPVIPGHEFAGEVVEVGNRVTHVKVGDAVAIDPNIHCGICPYCRRGLIHFCADLVALGVSIPGGFQEFCRVPANQIYVLPPGLPLEEAAFAEPLACCVHGIDRARVEVSDSVVILGAGTIGLLMVQLARLAGAGDVIVSEPSAAKAELARRLGADCVVDPTAVDLRAVVEERTRIGADVVIECVGNPGTVAQALSLSRRGGRIVLFGVNPKEAEVAVRPYDLFLNELTIVGSYINPYTHARAIELLSTGRVRAQELISHRLPLAEFAQAMALAERGGAVKIMVEPSGVPA